ncbi:MAG: 4Fe-4S binding protein [Candidatus Ranarchaeia archaeon]
MTGLDPKKVYGYKDIPPGAISWAPGSAYKTGPWRTSRPIYDANLCINCGFCWSYCPDNAVIWTPEKRKDGKDKTPVIEIDWDACKGCGVCAEECPKQAYTMEREPE